MIYLLIYLLLKRSLPGTSPPRGAPAQPRPSCWRLSRSQAWYTFSFWSCGCTCGTQRPETGPGPAPAPLPPTARGSPGTAAGRQVTGPAAQHAAWSAGTACRDCRKAVTESRTLPPLHPPNNRIPTAKPQRGGRTLLVLSVRTRPCTAAGSCTSPPPCGNKTAKTGNYRKKMKVIPALT